MITKYEDGSVLIVVDKIHLKLNPNELTQAEIDLITAYNPDNAEQVIAAEIKMRKTHKDILAKDELEIIEQMVAEDPNKWFIDYCNSRNIIF